MSTSTADSYDIKQAVETAIVAALNSQPASNEAFLTAISLALRKDTLPYGLTVDQKHDEESKSEKLYDICIYRKEDVLEPKWPQSSFRGIAKVFAAIEIENEQGPGEVYRDLWKVVFSRAKHRVFCGGISKKGNGDNNPKRMIDARITEMQRFYDPELIKDLILIFYPAKEEWPGLTNAADQVSAYKLPV